MTHQEQKCIEATKDLWNLLIDLPEHHPDDVNDYRFHIHAIQHMLFARAELRRQKILNEASVAAKRGC